MKREFPKASYRPLMKVCGVTRAEDAGLALDEGAAFIGLIMARDSPRYVSPQQAKELARAIRVSHPGARLIGVFRGEPAEEIAELARTLNLFAVQIHGDAAPAAALLGEARVIPAIGVESAEDAERAMALPVGHPAVLADASVRGKSGGTGTLFDHAYIQPHFASRRILIAGGLAPENLADVLDRIGRGAMPYGFDVSSGLEESPGLKSPDRIREFFRIYNEFFDV